MLNPRTTRARPPRSGPRAPAPAVVAAVALLALLAAGCGGSSEDSSSSPTPKKPAQSSSRNASAGDQAARFSQCMRKHGVPDFPDPVDGKLTLKVEKGTDMDPGSPQFQSADKACKSLEPAGLLSGSGQSQGQQTQLLKFVDCMHKHGVPNFPDPDPQGHVVLGGDFDPNSPEFQSAMQACRSLIPGGGAAIGG